MMDPIPLDADIVARFKDKTMAIVGYESNQVHLNLDFCALEICVFDFCGVLNYRHPLKFAVQNLDFCGKNGQNSKIH